MPRSFKPPASNIASTQLHIFCDASATGYGAVAYFRFLCEDDTVHCSFVMGRSRIFPLKPITAPRLELTAAVIAVKMKEFLLKESGYNVESVYLWTDSTAVIQYNNNTSSRFQVFVANRLARIPDGSTASEWRHVPGKLNPADTASRGLAPKNYEKATSWFKEQEFLYKKDSGWPQMPPNFTKLPDNDPEVRMTSTIATTTEDPAKETIGRLLQHFSSWKRLTKAVAWLL